MVLAHCLWAQSRQPGAQPQRWVASWGASQQVPEPQNELPSDDLRDATVRQIVHLSVGGSAVRVHVTNAFGTEALQFTSVHIARPLSSSSATIDPVSDRPLTFGGQPAVTVFPGAKFVSDPVDYPVGPLSDLAVTFHLDLPPARRQDIRDQGQPPTMCTAMR
jgi:hypothetical protein